MPIDTTVPGSAGWWAARLGRQLGDKARVDRLEMLDQYWKGNARGWRFWDPGPDVSEPEKVRRWQAGTAARDAVIRRSRTNFTRLVINVARQRMQLRTISTAVDSDVEGDDVAMSLWRGNVLDLRQSELYLLYLLFGAGFLSVGLAEPGDADPTDPDTGLPVITVDSPMSMVASCDPRRPERVRAALKVFNDPDQQLDYAYLWLPGELYVATRPNSSRRVLKFSPDAYEWDDSLSASWPQPVVPISALDTEDGMGDTEPHLDILDRIDHDTFMRDTIALYQAFMQRGIEGDLPETDPTTGKKIDYDNIFSADPGALWRLGPTAKIWEGKQADLGPVRSMANDDIKMLASVTSTPLYVVSPDVAQSAEGVSSMREALVYRVEAHQARAAQALARAISLGLTFMGQTERAPISGLQVSWYPAERFSLAERAQADSLSVSLTWQQKQELIWQQTPQQIARAQSQRIADSLLNDAVTAATAARTAPTLPVAPAPAAAGG